MTESNVIAIEDLRRAVRQILTDEGLSQTEAARLAGLKAPTFSQWLNKKYPGDNDAIEAQIRKWLSGRKRAVALSAALPPIPEFFDTPTARRIVAALQYAQLAGDIAVIHGGAGHGKSTACRYYRDASSNVWLAGMNPGHRGCVPALEEVCDAVGIKNAPQGVRKMLRAIGEKVARTGGLLVIDEANHLGPDALEALRSLHDSAGIGLALVGNDLVYAQLTGGTRSAHFAQLFSRIGKRVPLKRAAEGDVKALLEAWEVAGKPERDFVGLIAGKPGALRNATKALRLASMLAAAEGESLGLDHLRRAWTDLSAEEALG